jgi:hypothetical protein
MDKTIITTNHSVNDSAIFYYEPSSPDLNATFRLSGITLDGNAIANGIKLRNVSNYIISNIRIDHCKIQNCYSSHVFLWGDVYGCMDNDTIYAGNNNMFYATGNQYVSWTHSRAFGNANNFIIEDNTLSGHGMFIVSQGGARFLFRYNNFIATGDCFPIIDMHGNANQYYGVSVVEIYGNHFDMQNHLSSFIDDRGGQALFYFNRIINNNYGVTTKVREEFLDSINPLAANDGTNPTPGHNSFVQHVTNTYYWNNRYSSNTPCTTYISVEKSGTAAGGGTNYLTGTGFDATWADLGPRFGLYLTGGPGVGEHGSITVSTTTQLTIDHNWITQPTSSTTYQVTDDCCNILTQNVDFWNPATVSYTVPGAGCGTLAAMPAKAPPGSSYWATAQYCDSVANVNVGINPTLKLTGTFYKYGVDSLPVSYYTPYTYPHPLQGKSNKQLLITIVR